MSWFGKLLGGGLGMAFGGPLGAVVGAALGHAFVDAQAGGGRERLSPLESRQALFFSTVFAMLGKMAKADGRVSPEEIAAVERFMGDQLRLGSEARQLAITIFNEAKDDPTPFGAYVRQFGEAFADAPEMRRLLFQLLLDVALADGTLHEGEDGLLREALDPLGVPHSAYERVRGHLAPDLDPLYALLGVGAEASDEDLKRAYRKAVREYHPDTIASKGLPEEFTRFAEEKFKEINRAYETIRDHRQGAGAA